MRRPMLLLSHERLTAFDLDAFVAQAEVCNQHNRDPCTTPLPKAPSRGLSHAHCTPHSLAFTTAGEVDGGLSWLVGTTLDCSFPRSFWAPSEGARGAPGDDPASLVVLEGAATVDQDVAYAHGCRDLHHRDKGRRYPQLAGLHDAMPGEDDLGHCRSRVGAEGLDQTLAEVVARRRAFGLLTGDLVATDGPRAPSSARYQGCPYAREGCQAFCLDAAHRQALGEQLHRGAKRRPITCPCPAVVDKVRAATTKKGNPKAPTGSLSESEAVPHGAAAHSDWQPLAPRLALPYEAVPPVPLTGWHGSRGPQGALLGSCPKVPADREATVSHHSDTQDPSHTEEVFGSVQLQTTARNLDLDLE